MHESLENHYRLNTKLILDFSFSIETLEDMMPFEREVYVALIVETQEKKKNQNGIT